MFPGAYSEIYRNEDGEITGWDYPAYDEPEEPDYDRYDEEDDDLDGDEQECIRRGVHGNDGDGTGVPNEFACTRCGGTFILE